MDDRVECERPMELAELCQRPSRSKPQPLREGSSSCKEAKQVHPSFSSGSERTLELFGTFMFSMVINKCKPIKMSLSSICYLFLEEFWPHKACSWCWIKMSFFFFLNPGNVFISLLHYFLNTPQGQRARFHNFIFFFFFTRQMTILESGPPSSFSFIIS